MHGKVMDVKGWVEGDEPEPNKKVIMYSQKKPGQDNQLWYEDSDGIIRCKLGNFALDSAGLDELKPNA